MIRYWWVCEFLPPVKQRGAWLNDEIFMGLWISPPMKSSWTLAWLNDEISMGLWIFTTCEISVDPGLIKWWNIYGPVDFYHLWNQRAPWMMKHLWACGFLPPVKSAWTGPCMIKMIKHLWSCGFSPLVTLVNACFWLSCVCCWLVLCPATWCRFWLVI